MRCLWVARALPFPLTAGDRIYSAQLAKALAATGAEVVFVGLAGDQPPTSYAHVTWQIVPGHQVSDRVALLSRFPLVTARHATTAYRKLLLNLIAQHEWDAIIVDHYGAAWVLAPGALVRSSALRVFVTHNHEASVTATQWQDKTRALMTRLYLWQNWWKTRRLERMAANSSDLVTTITDDDAREFRRDAPGVPIIKITPGYDGDRLETRDIHKGTPRAIILFGSYRWSAKRANLSIFLDHADNLLSKAGISIQIVGDIDETWRRKLSTRYPSVNFHGFVDDPSGLLSQARIAVVAEPVGGGFKLKFLQYIFNRLPIAALTACVAGLPEAVSSAMMLEPDLGLLLARVVAEIDNVAELNERQRVAFSAAQGLYSWSDRGKSLHDAIRRLRQTAGVIDG